MAGQGVAGEQPKQSPVARVGIHSNVKSDASFTAGHVWITVQSPDGKIITYGLWPDDHPRTVDNGEDSDVRIGLEDRQKAVASKYYDLSLKQYDALNVYINISAEWGYTCTCADWARDAIYRATGDYLDVDDYFGFETPRELSRSLGK